MSPFPLPPVIKSQRDLDAEVTMTTRSYVRLSPKQAPEVDPKNWAR